MKSTQIFLEDSVHKEMVKAVALRKSKGDDMTNQKYIIESVKKEIERSKNERKHI